MSWKRFVPPPRELRGLRGSLPAVVWLATAGCATAIETGLPLDDPAALTQRAMARRGADEPTVLRFEWRYGDRQGSVSGDGVGRFTPTDSIRLDLFAPGDVGMAVALTEAGLGVLGEIEDVELPPLPFLYAMAGIFRPGASEPAAGYEGKDGGDILVFKTASGSLIYYFITPELKLSRVEEQRDDRTTRRLEITWPDPGEPAEWPRKAEYRDFEAPNRVRWDLQSSETAPTGFPAHIYDLSA